MACLGVSRTCLALLEVFEAVETDELEGTRSTEVGADELASTAGAAVREAAGRVPTADLKLPRADQGT